MELSNDITVLKGLVAKLLARIEGLEAENTALKAENAELRQRLGQNSKNSHKPPSSDGLGKKPAFKQSKGKKSGGQAGHPGKTLAMVPHPDQVIVHHAPFCPCCARVFSPADVAGTSQKRQVFDIPRPRLEVTEHQLGLIVCCGQTHQGEFPSTVNYAVQYGPQIKALGVLLNTDYKIPFEKIEQLLGDLYGCSFNESTAISANDACYANLADTETAIQAEILAAGVVHCDETGMRVEGKLHWFHTASTALFTYLFVHAHRGKEALQSPKSLLKGFKNWVVHDCWASYFDFPGCRHALCNAHILRELQALQENGSQWAASMKDLLLELYGASQKGKEIVENPPIWQEKYQNICQQADQEEPPPRPNKRGKPTNPKGRNLLNRLVKYQDGVLAFAFHQAVPFTNNQAERDIRCLKTKQKVATSFRTFKGAECYARIQSFVSTLRKHNMNVFQNLIHVFNKETVVFRYS